MSYQDQDGHIRTRMVMLRAELSCQDCDIRTAMSGQEQDPGFSYQDQDCHVRIVMSGRGCQIFRIKIYCKDCHVKIEIVMSEWSYKKQNFNHVWSRIVRVRMVMSGSDFQDQDCHICIKIVTVLKFQCFCFTIKLTSTLNGT